MELTLKQKQGLDVAVARYKSHKPYTVISGYAGSGKSTIIKFIISALELNPEDVAYIAYTGKASEVLREKGCPNAMTAHKLLYNAKRKPNGKFSFAPRSSIGYYKLIVVDEVSMLPKDMWNLLLSHNIHILAAGDPAQLPPIRKDQDNEVLQHPHVFLDEIMRQAQDSDIIKSSMIVREGKPLTPFLGKDIQIFRKEHAPKGIYTWADQIIVATNNKRKEINDLMRKLANRNKEPEIGDKIICLKNCWDMLSEHGEPLINGSIGYIDNMTKTYIDYIGKSGERYTVPILLADVCTSENDCYKQIPIDYTAITTGEKYLTPEQEFWINKKNKDAILPIEFNYGYAITCHRAQGSQWGKVLVIEERFPFSKEEHIKWLYTSLTRPEKKCVVILK